MKKKAIHVVLRELSFNALKFFVAMKLTFFLSLLVVFSALAGETFSQSKKLSLDMREVTVQEVLSTIENQSEYYFLYSEQVVDVERKVSLNVRNQDLQIVLDDLFAGTDVTYAIKDRIIVLSASGSEAAPVVAGQQSAVTGRVTDGSGMPLPGVSVVVKGTTMGTITDAEGNYTLTGLPPGAVLQFSFVGMLPREVEVGTRTRINVSMKEDVIGLEEVVAVGYGVQKKTDVTGAVISVTSEKLNSMPSNNAMEALQGRAAGVDVISTLRPGTIGEIYIRGVRSLTASNAPLYVVDGIPLMSSSGIETINPQDIETVDILKDASATAIYGSRGANGVVLVTTKRGDTGKLSVNYSGSLTSQDMVWRSDYMNVEEYIDFARWAAYNKSPGDLSPGDQPSLENDGKIELFTADPVAWANIQKGWEGGTWDPSRVETFDWMDAVTQANLTQEHTLSVSGGTRNMKGYASFGYLDNQGTTKGQEFQRYSLRINLDVTPKEWIRFGSSINASYLFQDYGQASIGASMSSPGSLVESAARIYPYALPYDSEGNLVNFPGGQSRVANVLNEWNYSTNERETYRILANLYTEIEIIKGLRYRMNFGPDFRSYRNGVYNDGKSVVRGGSSYASYGGNFNFSWTIDNLLYYDKSWDRHNFGVTLLQTASKWKYENWSMAAQGIAIPSMEWYAMGSVSALDSWGTGLTERQLSSYMGRLNYSYQDKYLVTLSGRWDGASQLAEGNKWEFFPSVALGWRMEQEDFLTDISWINQLKLRAGYGATGNSAVDPYTTKGGVDLVQQPYGSSIVPGYTSSSSLSNQALGWEKTTQYNVGVDFSLFRGRLNGNIDLYRSKTKDLLMTMALPSVTGYVSTLANVGETKNRGVDFSMNSINIRKGDWTWESNLNLAWQKDEIVSLMNGKEDMVADGWFIGQSISVNYDYDRLGLWQDTPEDLAEMARFNANGHNFTPGSVKVKDQNGDYRITSNDDRVIVGNSRPRWTVGLNNSIKFRNWDFSLFITGRLKYLRNVGEGLTSMYGDQRVLDYWTPDNPDAEYQKPIRDEAGGDSYAYTYYKDDSYLKIRNISLGYSLPASLVSRLGISDLRVYVQVKDAGMLWSNNTYLDSEYGSLYFNRGTVFGLSVGL
ncbi:MAG: TonB-dependent receptor [Mangrovibacterium sp.]